MIKVFKGNNFDSTLSEAKKELGDDFYYIVCSEKNDPECVLETYNLNDVAEYGKKYLYEGIKSLNIESNIDFNINNEEKIINILVSSNRNSILIGSSGKTLRAFNTLLRIIISNRFKRKFRIFLDIGNYKNKKFFQIINIARKVAKEAIRQRFDVKMDNMTSEERKIIHQSLIDIKDIKTESVGEEENNKFIILRYQGEKSDNEIHYYKDLLSLENDEENYKNEFRRYGNNSFNNFYKENLSGDNHNFYNNYDNEGVSVFTNLSFLEKTSLKKNPRKNEIKENIQDKKKIW